MSSSSRTSTLRGDASSFLPGAQEHDGYMPIFKPESPFDYQPNAFFQHGPAPLWNYSPQPQPQYPDHGDRLRPMQAEYPAPVYYDHHPGHCRQMSDLNPAAAPFQPFMLPQMHDMYVLPAFGPVMAPHPSFAGAFDYQLGGPQVRPPSYGHGSIVWGPSSASFSRPGNGHGNDGFNGNGFRNENGNFNGNAYSNGSFNTNYSSGRSIFNGGNGYSNGNGYRTGYTSFTPNGNTTTGPQIHYPTPTPIPETTAPKTSKHRNKYRNKKNKAIAIAKAKAKAREDSNANKENVPIVSDWESAVVGERGWGLPGKEEEDGRGGWGTGWLGYGV